MSYLVNWSVDLITNLFVSLIIWSGGLQMVMSGWLFILEIGPRNEVEGTDEEKGSRADFVICKDRKSVDIMLDVGRIV